MAASRKNAQKPAEKKTTRETLSDTTGLTQLGSGQVGTPERKLEAFPFRHRGRDTVVTFHCTEFSCHCPLTGQPDFATLEISYIPKKRALESKSLKIYLFSFRNHGSFHEEVTNRILDDVVAACQPRRAKVIGAFRPRGGIAIHVTAEYEATPK